MCLSKVELQLCWFVYNRDGNRQAVLRRVIDSIKFISAHMDGTPKCACLVLPRLDTTKLAAHRGSGFLLAKTTTHSRQETDAASAVTTQVLQSVLAYTMPSATLSCVSHSGEM